MRGHDEVEIVIVDLEEGLVAQRPREVDEYVDPTEFLDDARDQRVHRTPVADIETHAGCTAPGALELGC